jgi:hypothetical protein
MKKEIINKEEMINQKENNMIKNQEMIHLNQLKNYLGVLI